MSRATHLDMSRATHLGTTKAIRLGTTKAIQATTMRVNRYSIRGRVQPLHHPLIPSQPGVIIEELQLQQLSVDPWNGDTRKVCQKVKCEELINRFKRVGAGPRIDIAY